MERIVQLRESEYEELVKVSKLNEKQIAEQAEKLWKERGVAKVELKIYEGSKYSFGRELLCDAWVWHKDDRFFIPDKLRESLGEFVRTWVRYEIDAYYGEPLQVIKSYNKKEEELNRWFRVLWLVAVSGWVVASILLLGYK